MSQLKISNATVCYDGMTVLNDVSLSVGSGVSLLLGQSGSGKTTLLRCVAGLVEQFKGNIEFCGSVGYVSQQFDLFSHMTALENCTHAAMHVKGIAKAEAEERACQILRRLGVEFLAHRKPKQMSGGQQQRVAIARALSMQPEVLMLDEPTSALDPENTKQLQTLLQSLAADGLTLLISTHDMPFAEALQGRVYFMSQGRIVEKC